MHEGCSAPHTGHFTSKGNAPQVLHAVCEVAPLAHLALARQRVLWAQLESVRAPQQLTSYVTSHVYWLQHCLVDHPNPVKGKLLSNAVDKSEQECTPVLSCATLLYQWLREQPRQLPEVHVCEMHVCICSKNQSVLLVEVQHSLIGDK